MEVEGVLLGVSIHLFHVSGLRKRLTLQIPQATVHSSLVAEAWFA